LAIRRWTWQHWAIALVSTLLTAVVLGVPSALLANPFFLRMTPAPWWSCAVWPATAVLTGLLVASYFRPTAVAKRTPARAGIAANVASFLALGCPVCNKLVIAAVGVSGALSVWAPIQPVVATASLALLGWVVRRRFTAPGQCPVPARGDDDGVRPEAQVQR
jgi:hypothetical protein